MNMSELATKMLEWETVKGQLDTLEKEIKAAVLEVGKTQTVGNVRASYSGGRNKYDYKTPAALAAKVIIERHSVTSTTTITDWKLVCKDAHIEPVLLSKSAPSVTVKLE